MLLMAAFPSRLSLVCLLLVSSVLLNLCSGTPASAPETEANESDSSRTYHSNKSSKAFPVVTVDFGHVRSPFVVALWILLASVLKL
eukprot:g39669.t1